jgi:arylformamidase
MGGKVLSDKLSRRSQQGFKGSSRGIGGNQRLNRKDDLFKLMASGEWVDLSQPFCEEMPHRSAVIPPLEGKPIDIPRIPALEVRPIEIPFKSTPGRLRVTSVTIGTHFGTHVDAELHFCEGGQTIDAYPVRRFVGPGVVLFIPKSRSEPITAEELDQAKPQVKQNDILLIRTGWDEKYLSEAYFDHPYLNVDAAQWIIKRGVSIVGIDMLTVDLPNSQRQSDFDWPIHRLLLASDVLVIENLANLKSVENRRILVAAIPIKFKGLDGAPARVVGFLPNSRKLV